MRERIPRVKLPLKPVLFEFSHVFLGWPNFRPFSTTHMYAYALSSTASIDIMARCETWRCCFCRTLTRQVQCRRHWVTNKGYECMSRSDFFSYLILSNPIRSRLIRGISSYLVNLILSHHVMHRMFHNVLSHSIEL